ncbi:MAG: hypothetical protein JNN28_02990, partial [Saprospiraceae bacterium]|nr:hypothetical protein [Saprospiraceae bacterium]
MKHYYSISLFWVWCVFGLQIVAAQPIITLTSMTPSGCTACTGGADISVSGTQPFTYIWSNNATMQDLAGICSGNYTVTVTDANGLTNTTIVSVGQVSSINLSTIITHVSCNGSNNGAINLTISGGVSPYTTLWNNGSITEDLNNLTAGTYTPTVTDATGCTKTISAVVTQPSPINPTICVTNLPCNGSCNGSKIDLTVTGGASPYSYIWGTGSTTQDLTNICAGIYTVTVTDMNGCTKTATGVVTAPAAITVSGAVTDASSGISNGSIDLTLAGGTPPYLAQWSTGSSSIDLNQLSGGTYCVTITDANNCTKTSCFTVQGNGGGPYFGPPLINGIATNSGCGTNCSGAINLTVVSISPQNTFDWMHIPGANNPQNITNVCEGSYCVTVTDTEGNTASACYTVGQGTIQHIIIESSNAAFCNFDPNNSSNVCEMVCPQSTVTYFVDPPVICGQPMNLSGATWTISGAKSYTITPGLPEVVVTWGDAGPGLIEFSSNTQQLCFESTHCVTVLEQPKAQFSTDPPTLPNVPMQLCKGQSVSFRNESLYAELYEWIFSDDLSVLNEESPSHTFKTPGNFSVTLIARNNCLCADTLQWLVEVLDSDPPLLDCVGSVCPGETVTYTTSSGCSAYQWMVSPNGSILQGGQSGDNTITIQWSDGPVGSISLSATGCSGASCAQASIFQISIISDNAEIRGEQFVCPNSEEAYQIDLFDGTEYTWTLPTGGTILRGQGTNEVTVAWNAQIGSAMHWLIVDYYNCYLECGGTDSIPVKIIPPFFIDGPVEICDQATKNYTARTASTQLNVNCAWSVYAPDGTLSATFTGSTYSFSPTAGPGIYRLFAEPVGPGQSCSPNAEIKVSVLARPPKPVSISGPVLVCPGNPVAYQVPGNPPYEMIWTTGNGSPSSQSGNPVNVTWNSNPTHWLSVMQVSLDGLGCKSDTAQLEVQNAYHISISGPATLCEGTVGFYTADFYPGFDYQWEILPATAGIIKQGQGKNNIEVFWQTPGSHKLRVTTCGLTLDFTVTVLANPLPLPLYPEGVCPGVPGLVTITGPYTNFVWQNADGPIIGNSSSINLFPGSYVISVTDVNGCKGASEFSINKLPAPNV